MKRILIPTDFSNNSWNATRYALDLFKDEACTFFLLNTYTPAIANSRFMASTINGRQIDGVLDISIKGLNNVVKGIEETCLYKNHSFKTISSFSLLVDEIKDVVEREQIDLIVMGTKGASGLEEVFLGSNTVRIIKSVGNCPVLVVPHNFEFFIPSEIAFATDFNRFYTQSELQPLIDMVNAFGAIIRIVYVQNKIMALTELQQFNLTMLRKYLKNTECYVHTVSELNSVSKTLEIFADELGIHLLAMLNYQHSYMEKITREPVVKRLAFHTQIPLLVIPELSMNLQSKKKKGEEVSVSKQ